MHTWALVQWAFVQCTTLTLSNVCCNLFCAATMLSKARDSIFCKETWASILMLSKVLSGGFFATLGEWESGEEQLCSLCYILQKHRVGMFCNSNGAVRWSGRFAVGAHRRFCARVAACWIVLDQRIPLLRWVRCMQCAFYSRKSQTTHVWEVSLTQTQTSKRWKDPQSTCY